MAEYTRFVGLDVHASIIAVAVMDKDGTQHWLGNIPNEPKSIRRLVKKLGRVDHLQVDRLACGATRHVDREGRFAGSVGRLLAER